MSFLADAHEPLGAAPAGHAQPEEVVLRVRRHGRILTVPVILLVAVAAAASYWIGTLPEAWMNILAGVGAALIVLFACVGPILAWLTRRTTVTTRRVIFRHGVFVRHRSEVPFSRVREVRTRRGLGQRAFGAGTIDLLVGPDTVSLTDVPDAPAIAEVMQELVERNYEHSTGFFSAGLPGGVPGGIPGGPPGGPLAAPMPSQSRSPSPMWGAQHTQRTQRLGG